jgi:hypothetical protein
MINNLSTAHVRNSIYNSIKNMGEYWTKCLAQRSLLGKEAQGSGYNLTPEQIQKRLLSATWIPYFHPSIMPGCMAFQTGLEGALGVVPIESLSENESITLQDPKGTGKVEATIKNGLRVFTDFTVIIIGKEGGQNVVFTFHPGAPIGPSTLPSEGNQGRVVSKTEALSMGLQYAKIA